MNFSVLTIFPAMFDAFVKESITGRAVNDGIVKINLVDIRDYTKDRHKRVDDRPYGGGAGMVMKPEPLSFAVESVKKKDSRVIALTPQGKTFSQRKAASLSMEKDIILVCGRYEGIDERFYDFYVDEEISIGDYILTGGEIPAMVLMDCVIRLLPGVLGCSESPEDESFSQGRIEYPHYTRPYEFKGVSVPDILLSGNHGAVSMWRKTASLIRTLNKRPDLFFSYPETEDEKKILSGLLRRLEDFDRK